MKIVVTNNFLERNIIFHDLNHILSVFTIYIQILET